MEYVLKAGLHLNYISMSEMVLVRTCTTASENRENE